MRHTAADAHWQLGKVERHGQWLCRVFQRVLDEIRPQSNQSGVIACPMLNPLKTPS